MSGIRLRSCSNILHPSSLFNHLKSTCERRPLWSNSKKKTLSKTKEAEKPLELAKGHKKWTVEQCNVLWRDESKFEIFSSKWRQYVRRRIQEWMKDVCFKPAVKHGRGFIMVCGRLTVNGVVDLVRIDGIINAVKYRQILIHHAIW